MINNLLKFIIFFFTISNFFSFSNAQEEFNFDITEIKITQNGNLIIGIKGGIARTVDGYEIIGENFVYNKLTNILKVSGNVKLINSNDDFTIFTDKATYLKNDEIVFTEGNSKAINENNTITASNFKFNKIQNILNAEKNVKFFDIKKNTSIFSDKATYLKNDEIVFTEGKTDAIIEGKYEFLSKNIKYSKNNQELSSDEKSTILDNENIYNIDNFLYQLDQKILKGKNLNIVSKVEKNKSDNYFFSEGIFDFKNQSFLAKETKVKVHKDIFGNDEQDPRIYGASSSGDENKTIINKGIFTSCKIKDNCPPWSIHSKKITHDKIKKDIIYDNAVLKIYDIPILYFPKFFHPDPTVKRRSGFLQPQFNRNNTIGDSLYIPYYFNIGPDEDYTLKPTIFDDKKKYILQNEYRKENKFSSFIADFSFMRGYKSSNSNKEKNINHIFVTFNKDLNLPNYLESKMNLRVERVNNDTYLKVFQNNLFPSPAMPSNKNLMQTSLDHKFKHEDFDLSTSFQVFEQLGTKHSDRHQFVLPSYDYAKNFYLDNNYLDGSVNFSSSGSNNLLNTNNLITSVTNDVAFNSTDYFTDNGIKFNYNLFFKNFNSVGKNDPTYKSSPSIEGSSLIELSTSYPLIKNNNLSQEILTPKVSLRSNLSDNMKNSSTTKNVDDSNIFSINRLGITDSFEAGKSLTLGFDYKLDLNEDGSSKDKFLEFNLSTVLRDKVESQIPESSTIDKKMSNIFGSIQNNLFENLNVGYKFSIDNDLKTFESHQISTEFSINNFVTTFYYDEKKGKLGSDHVISNKTSYMIDENNSFSFSTSRNKEISLTEYYDFSYEYKNDCLTAGIKYNRTFYQDNDLVPSENLFFTITLIPLTTYERILYERDAYGN